MEDHCGRGRERLGVSFTIDYLLYNKVGKKEATEETPRPTAEQEKTIQHSLKEELSPQDSSSDGEGRRDQGKESGGSDPENQEEEEEEEVQTATESPEDKPSHSYIALISMAILASLEKKLLLCDIYQWIMDHYPYFKSKDKNWRNSVRHNLSLNECFVKAGRSDNGKGHFWAIHPVNYRDFSNGDYHRRRARRRTRRVAVQLPYAPLGPSPSHPLLHRLQGPGVPCWFYPPAPLSLSCLPPRLYWCWAGLQRRRPHVFQAPCQ